MFPFVAVFPEKSGISTLDRNSHEIWKISGQVGSFFAAVIDNKTLIVLGCCWAKIFSFYYSLGSEIKLQ